VTSRRSVLVVLACALLALGIGASAAASKLPPLPHHWPGRLGLGLSDSPGGAKALHKSVPLRFRYQYLAGGVNTGEGWATWNSGGTFVDGYVSESVAAHLVPVFSYYMIRQSLPGRDDGDEPHAVLSNLRNSATMRAWLDDLRLFMQRAARFPTRTVVLQVEPDMWGYVEQAAKSDDAAMVPAAVASTGAPDAAGLPNTAAGLARAVVRLRDRLAPNVLLGYHASEWGTGVDLSINDPSSAQTDAAAARAARFFRSLGSHFDVTFTDWSDRDAAFKRTIYGAGPDAWWTSGDYSRAVRFVRGYSHAAGQRVVVWQIPLGNTLMRAMNDTWGHFQDNHVQWLLGKHGRAHLRSLARAGAVAFLFGGGADGTTCACDGRGDGKTNPAPINGNGRGSYSADDDGGYFRHQARAYHRAGVLHLP
jgi:hypothetical protein